MKMFICKECGYIDYTSSDTWKVIRQDDDIDASAELKCPKCGNGKFLTMKLDVNVSKSIKA